MPKITFQGLTPLPCQSPKNVRFSNINHASAKLNWSPPGSGNTPASYDVYYSTSRYKPYAATTTPYNTTDTQTVLSGLNADTWYYAWIRNHSLSCNSVWTVVDSFETLCAPVPAPSAAEQFNSFVPNCWERARGLLANPTVFLPFQTIGYYQYWIKSTYQNQSGSTNFAAKAIISSDTLKHWLISQPYDLGTAGNSSLEFDMALTLNGNSNQGTLNTDDKFAVVISTDEGITWSSANTLRTWAYSQSILNTGQQIIIPLSTYTGIVRIGFYVQSTVANGNPNLFIDNVKLTGSIMPVTLMEFTGKQQGNNNC